MRKQRK